MSRAASDWITIGEAVEILAAANVHVVPDTLARWARTGRLQTVKIGGRRYVRRGEVRNLLRPKGPGAAAAHEGDDEPQQPGLFEGL